MTTHPTKFILTVFAAFLASIALLQAETEEKQPHMESALHFLQEAKTSDTPAKLLTSAKEELEKARHNKHGFRDTSLEIVDKALALAAAGDHDKMIEKIDAAIANIHDGMAHAPGRR